jgi:hypothetical protein
MKFTCNVTFSRVRIPASLFVHLVFNVPVSKRIDYQLPHTRYISYKHVLLHIVPAFTETKLYVLVHGLLYTPTYTDRSNV